MPVKKSAKSHIVYHKDGSIWAKGKMKDGTRMRRGHFKVGKQYVEWVTYDKMSKVYKITNFK